MPAKMTLYGLPYEIWLNGRIACGKDTFAKALADHYGYWTRGVGQLIATEIEAAEGLAPGFIYRTPGEKDRRRSQLQDWGNKGRAEDPHYWLKAWLRERTKVAHLPAIQTSCRFIYEAQEALRRRAAGLDVVVIKLVVPEDLRQERIKVNYPSHTVAQDQNAAEAEIDTVPYNIELRGDLTRKETPYQLAMAYKLWQGCGCPIYAETPESADLIYRSLY